MSDGCDRPLFDLDVLVVDCQATAAAPRGHLLEIGWACAGRTTTHARTCLVALPAGARIPPSVTRITGISEPMMNDGVDPRVAWSMLSDRAATLQQQPAPTIIHYARFEQPFLTRLAGGTLPLDVVCTHDIARRLLPDLPRRSLRALAGYFGCAVDTLRRSAEHVDATAFVWRELIRLLEASGVSTWPALHEWLAAPIRSTHRSRRVWPMPREVRLSLPDAPGVYRMLRRNGGVLYVGKAASLHHRVNSHFRHQHGLHERTLEMLSQARSISFEVAGSALEAALLEADEIKRHRPPYNVALTIADRAVWFARPDLSGRSPRPSTGCAVGPFPSADTLDQFSALARGSRAALGRGRWGPDLMTFADGYARFCARHDGTRESNGTPAALLDLGTRLWREGRRDRDIDLDESEAERRSRLWTPEIVQTSLEWLVIRSALACRRAKWLTWLVDASVVWREHEAAGPRLIVIELGDITYSGDADDGLIPPVPPGHVRPVGARHEAFTVARFDRLRVLTTELKRLVAAGAPVAVRFGPGRALAGPPLASALSWI